jgi:hypothetical protein
MRWVLQDGKNPTSFVTRHVLQADLACALGAIHSSIRADLTYQNTYSHGVRQSHAVRTVEVETRKRTSSSKMVSSCWTQAGSVLSPAPGGQAPGWALQAFMPQNAPQPARVDWGVCGNGWTRKVANSTAERIELSTPSLAGVSWVHYGQRCRATTWIREGRGGQATACLNGQACSLGWDCVEERFGLHMP